MSITSLRPTIIRTNTYKHKIETMCFLYGRGKNVIKKESSFNLRYDHTLFILLFSAVFVQISVNIILEIET